MLKSVWTSLAVVAALTFAHGAHATTFDTFNNPGLYGGAVVFVTGDSLTLDVVDVDPANPDALANYNPADVGNYVILTADGTVADTLNVSDTGQIVFTSTEASPIAENPTDIAIGTEGIDSALGLRLFSTNPGGAVLGLTISTGSGVGDQISISVPEPASLTVIGAAIVGLGLLRRRQPLTR